jgi:putative hydrolase of the HAD superfamily
VAGPPALLVDFGGVLWNMRWDVCRALEAAHGLPRGAVFQTLYRCPDWADVERGRGDREAWLRAAHAALERAAARPLPPLHAEWRAAQGPIGENIALLRALKPRHRVALISNADLTLRERIGDGLGIIDLFDEIVCSAEVGCAKPEAAIFRLACRRLGLAPADCIFIDDAVENVAAAEALGMRGVVYRVDRGDDLGARLAALGVAVP